jgi:DNA-binding transcriptional regulator YdaS (Cro superfamily)
MRSCIEKLSARRGSLRALSRASGLDAGYLSRLCTGEKDAPSERVLEALGIERVVSYRLSRKAPRPFEAMTSQNAAAYHGAEDSP